jgi:hypothetical protein
MRAWLTALTLSYLQSMTAQWVQTGLSGDIDVAAMVAQDDRIFAGLFGWGGDSGGVYLSTDQGMTWNGRNEGLANTNVLCIAVNGDQLLAGTLGGGVFFSSDSGDRWTARNSGLTSLNINALQIRDGTFFAGSGLDGGVSVSTNQGIQWIPSNVGLTNLWIISLFTNGDELWTGTEDGCFLSTNNGLTWIPRGLAGVNISTFAVYASWLFAGGNFGGGVFRTSDNGMTWEMFDVGYYSTVNAYAVTDSLLIAGTSEGVFASQDEGITWEDLNTIPGPGDVRSLAISDSNIYAGTWSGGVWKRPVSEITVDVEKMEELLPSNVLLLQNYPNPFNPTTAISFQLTAVSQVSLKIFDLLGREVATLVNEKLAPGTYTRQWDATGFASGIYFYRLAARNFIQTRKLLLLR